MTKPDSGRLSPSRIANDHDLRSRSIEQLILETPSALPAQGGSVPPRLIVQFWDNIGGIPADVQACLDSWAVLERSGFVRMLFDDESARSFIQEHYDRRHLQAFSRCDHPAMRADYFRLCFILDKGGFYVDADDEYQGSTLDHLFDDSLLKLQPLCWDSATASMVDPVEYAGKKGTRVFYVNNNPLLSPPGHPVVSAALARATASLLAADANERDIQSLTGPGNLTATLVEHHIRLNRSGGSADFKLLVNWDSIAVSKWPLDYRSDDRNWRNWVQQND